MSIEDNLLRFERNEAGIARESRLDGIYIIRTSEKAEALSAEDTVRPIRHRSEDHVRAHIFLCMLAYYVEWHMRKALAPVLFQDEELEASRWQRHPVAKAEASESAREKGKPRPGSNN